MQTRSAQELWRWCLHRIYTWGRRRGGGEGGAEKGGRSAEQKEGSFGLLLPFLAAAHEQTQAKKNTQTKMESFCGNKKKKKKKEEEEEEEEEKKFTSVFFSTFNGTFNFQFCCCCCCWCWCFLFCSVLFSNFRLNLLFEFVPRRERILTRVELSPKQTLIKDLGFRVRDSNTRTSS
jgi:hypothetical protein